MKNLAIYNNVERYALSYTYSVTLIAKPLDCWSFSKGSACKQTKPVKLAHIAKKLRTLFSYVYVFELPGYGNTEGASG